MICRIAPRPSTRVGRTAEGPRTAVDPGAVPGPPGPKAGWKKTGSLQRNDVDVWAELMTDAGRLSAIQHFTQINVLREHFQLSLTILLMSVFLFSTVLCLTLCVKENQNFKAN